MARQRLAMANRPEPAPHTPMSAVQTLRLSDGRALCVRRWPGRSREPLVLLHGLLDSAEGWAGLCEHLAGGSIAFDLPGFGYSDPPTRGSIAGYARDVADGLDMLGVERMTLVGHSLGGAVATALAELLPDRVIALVLLAPAGFGRITIADAVSVPGMRKLVELTLPSLLSNRLAVSAAYLTMVTNGKSPDPDLVERLTSRGGSRVEGVREATRALRDAARSADAFHRRDVRYDGPVRAVWGNRDRLVPRSHSNGVLRAFSDARVEVWPGMGHHPMRERMSDLVEFIEAAIVEGRGQSNLSTLPLRRAA